MAKNKYSYPKIIMDNNTNYPGANTNIRRITVEEWNDLLHHTHEGIGSASSDETITKEQYDALKEEVDQLEVDLINNGTGDAATTGSVESIGQRIVTIENDVADVKSDLEGFGVTKADKTDLEGFATVEDLEVKANKDDVDTALESKADKADIEGFVTEEDLVDYAKMADVNIKANKTDLEDYAKKTDIANFVTADAIADKADKNDLEGLVKTEDIADFVKADAIEDLATAEALAAVKETANAAATQASVNAIAMTVEGKADKSELEGFATTDDVAAVDTKATSAKNTADLAKTVADAAATQEAFDAYKDEVTGMKADIDADVATVDEKATAAKTAADGAVASVTELTTIVAEKADKTELEGLVKTEDIADFITADDIVNKADKSELEGLATADALAGVKATADAAAVKADVDAALDLKADKTDLDSKADTSAVDQLELSIGEIEATTSDITSDVASLKTRVKSLEDAHVDEDIDEAEWKEAVLARIAALETENTTLRQEIQDIREESGYIVDYDLDKPGTQDLEGNTVFYIQDNSEILSAVADAETGAEIKLRTDVSTTEAGGALTFSGKDVTLNLNGNTLTAGNGSTDNINVSNGTLTLTNGNIVSNDPYDSTHKTTIVNVDSGGELIVDGVTITAVMENAVDEGQFGAGVYGSGKITVNSGEITTGWYAITGNGSKTNANAEVVVNGGKLTSTVDYAIYHPDPGTVTINGGTITGGAGAISCNAGKLIVNGGTLKTTGDGDTGSNWSDGTGGQSPAVINLNGKYGEVTCEINGGKFIALNNAPIIVSGTKYPVTITIKGGEFSQAPNSEWIADGYEVSAEPNAEGFYVVSKSSTAVDDEF